MIKWVSNLLNFSPSTKFVNNPLHIRATGPKGVTRLAGANSSKIKKVLGIKGDLKDRKTTPPSISSIADS
ncbi:hypothetical protein PPACK8108_LOCUS7318 [Phakopsora pachyrhizi]|uniref:Uncharacterized protein n=1 Tax=Phakopsora pachyrhizi TaxID=170000 RepID=A0AAV0AX19_PHAPC|nr:hypothetical protein PPACK8108_LOCUS7318 [Phakopsora pachyrhizi]